MDQRLTYEIIDDDTTTITKRELIQDPLFENDRKQTLSQMLSNGTWNFSNLSVKSRQISVKLSMILYLANKANIRNLLLECHCFRNLYY